VRAPPTWVLAAVLPPAAFVAGRLLGPGGPEGLFRAGLVALVAAVLAFAFLPLRARVWLAAAGLAALGVGLGFLLSGASPGEALGACALVAAHAGAAAGLASLGRAVGAGAVGAGAASAAVLAVALQGLFWADVAAERLPLDRRWAFRQSVLHLDGATALAYDAAAFDRMHHPPVYANVPLASSTFERPHGPTTALVWGTVGLCAAGVAALVADLGRRGRRFHLRARDHGEIPP
jgi:hypothetical protein